MAAGLRRPQQDPRPCRAANAADGQQQRLRPPQRPIGLQVQPGHLRPHSGGQALASAPRTGPVCGGKSSLQKVLWVWGWFPLVPVVGILGCPKRGPCRAQALLPHRTHATSSQQRLSAQENAPVMNGVSGPDSEDYNPWADRKAAQPKSTSPPQSQSKLSDSYSNTLPVRKSVAPKNSYATSKRSTGAPGPPGPQQSRHPRGEAGGSPEAHRHTCVQHPGDRFEISIPDP